MWLLLLARPWFFVLFLTQSVETWRNISIWIIWQVFPSKSSILWRDQLPFLKHIQKHQYWQMACILFCLPSSSFLPKICRYHLLALSRTLEESQPSKEGLHLTIIFIVFVHNASELQYMNCELICINLNPRKVLLMLARSCMIMLTSS